MNARATLLLAIIAALQVPVAHAQARKCPSPAQVAQRHMLGVWKADIQGVAAGLRMELKAHPEFAQTLRGSLQRGTQRVELAGDVTGGELTLEESTNGVNISATWLGEVVEGSCGREIRGRWKAEGMQEERPFVLKKR